MGAAQSPHQTHPAPPLQRTCSARRHSWPPPTAGRWARATRRAQTPPPRPAYAAGQTCRSRGGLQGSAARTKTRAVGEVGACAGGKAAARTCINAPTTLETHSTLILAAYAPSGSSPDSTSRRLTPGRPRPSRCPSSHCRTSCTFFSCTTRSASLRGACFTCQSCEAGAGTGACGCSPPASLRLLPPPAAAAAAAWLLATSAEALPPRLALPAPREGAGRTDGAAEPAGSPPPTPPMLPASSIDRALPGAVATGWLSCSGSAARPLATPEGLLGARRRERWLGRSSSSSSLSLFSAAARGRARRLLIGSGEALVVLRTTRRHPPPRPATPPAAAPCALQAGGPAPCTPSAECCCCTTGATR